MTEEKKGTEKSPDQIKRFYEQLPDAISFYSDFAQIISTGHEILMQFYETIPGPPSIGGEIKQVKTRLRATITISFPHAQNIGKSLIEKVKLE